MKPCWAWLMLLAALAAPGCLMLPKQIEEPPPPPIEKSDLTPPPDVKPEQVNENNYKEMEQRLRDELERAQNAPLPGPR